MVKIKIKRIRSNAIIPKYAHEGDAGFDLYSISDYFLKSGEKVIIETGLQMEIPKGYFGSIRDRSGLAAEHGVHTLAGVIDSIYRGEIGVVMMNFGKWEFKINKGDRIAQMLIQSVEKAVLEEVGELSETSRGQKGFGSSGV